MIHPHSMPLSGLLHEEEIKAIELMRSSFGVDVTRTYQFWEAMVARLVAGTTTEHKCGWDVQLTSEIGIIRIEVKFSQEFECHFSNGTRPVFKFANPRGTGAPKSADVTVLIGLDAEANVYSWVVPSYHLRHSASITLTSPRARQYKNEGRYGMDAYLCPPEQILPEVCRAWRDHLSLDRRPRAPRAGRGSGQTRLRMTDG